MKTTALLTRARVSLQAGLFCGLLFAAVGAQATITVTDLNTSDANSITKIENEQWIYEDYNEKYRVPYQSHDGNAVVNSNGGFFDKKIDFSGVTVNTIYYLHFYITNTTPWDWSDYHFEFWDSSFTSRLANFPLEPTFGLYSDQFDNKVLADRDGVVGSVGEFWAPGSHDRGETGYYRLQVNMYDIFKSGDGSFGLRQVATVPEPSAIALFTLGLVGFMMSRRRGLRKTQ